MDPESLVRQALAEDLTADRDVTTDVFVGSDVHGAGWIEAREEAVVSGLDAVAAVFRAIDGELHLRALVADGARVGRLERVVEIAGRAASILRAERTALNFLGHLSGIATHTRELVEAVRPWGTKILCTRKTTPCLRDIEVAAVKHGGGDVFRTNLADAALVKDNHIGVLGGLQKVADKLEELRRRDRASAMRLLEQGKIEVSSLDELAAVVAMGWRLVLLDNFAPADVAEAVRKWGDGVFLEVSGGVTAANIRDYASAGAHAISVGALTHSSRAIDFSLEVERSQP